jgi:hypothetical protein
MRAPNDRLISILLRIYPASWRQEYGPELRHVLETRPLDAAAVFDVGWNGTRQRLCSAEPSMMFGVPMTLIVTAIFGLMIVAPPAYASEFDFSTGPRVVP